MIKLGNADNYVVSLSTPTTKEERALASVYDHVLDCVLASYPWNCATKMAKIKKQASFPTDIYGWDYAFAVPGDCVFIRRVADSETDDEENVLQYRRYGGYILTNSVYTDPSDGFDYIYLTYTFRNNDPPTYDARLIEALALYLAFYLCETITISSQKKQDIYAEFEKVIDELQRIDMLEGSQSAKKSAAFVDIRG